MKYYFSFFIIIVTLSCGMPQAAPAELTCLERAIDVVESSNEFKELKNMHRHAKWGWKVEESIDPEKDKAVNTKVSDKYTIIFCENKAEQLRNVSRFEFHPSTSKVYEYNVVEDNLAELRFDKRLLSEYFEHCK